jgi:hypothetical protein
MRSEVRYVNSNKPLHLSESCASAGNFDICDIEELLVSSARERKVQSPSDGAGSTIAPTHVCKLGDILRAISAEQAAVVRAIVAQFSQLSIPLDCYA